MGKNETMILGIVLELLRLLIDRANTGEEITDGELDENLKKAKEAIDRFKA